MSRKEALKLPNWEFTDLLRQYHKHRASQGLENLYSTSAGFNGGEAFKAVEGSLQAQLKDPVIWLEADEDTPLEDIFGINPDLIAEIPTI